MNNMKFVIFAMAAHGTGISGGDRIFIELSRILHKKNPVSIFVWEEGQMMIKSQNLEAADNLVIQVLSMGSWNRLGFLVCYIARIFRSIFEAMTLKVDHTDQTIVMSASEFWMDSLPCFVLKIRYPKIRWVAAWYQTAPNPLHGYTEGGVRENNYTLSALLYWLVQLPIKPLITYSADFVIVNNEEEKKQFPSLTRKGKTIVMLGAVKVDEIKAWQQKYKNVVKKYEAVFQGRFHPQKGVIELIDIWEKVVKKKKDARLAMIGDGPLMKSVKNRIREKNLEDNIELFGYVFDGDNKYTIFSQSNIVVHPALYDSGGMASAEAMAFGLPCIGFDLQSYKSYYPSGMVKVPIGDLDKFASKIVELLNDSERRISIGQAAVDMIQSNWSWNRRADVFLQTLEH
jgi:glycosyltransferase involved in cell wall biosynthesis